MIDGLFSGQYKRKQTSKCHFMWSSWHVVTTILS